MILDTQAAWDQDTAHHTRETLRKLAAKVRTAQELEATRNGEAKEARKTARQAHDKLTAAIEGDDGGDDLAYVRNVQVLTQEAETAREEEAAARQRWVLAVTARRKAQDELRVAVRRHMAPLPLFNRSTEPATNGHAAQEEESTPTPRACHKCGKLPNYCYIHWPSTPQGPICHDCLEATEAADEKATPNPRRRRSKRKEGEA